MHHWLRVTLPFLSLILGLLVVHAPANAKIGQAKVGNVAPAVQPKPTKTGHEVGFGTHITFPPGGIAFLPRARYRYQFHSTGVQGPLSGLWLEAAIGPAVYGDPDGNIALNLGYEFDPFSNLALTFSPVFRNDFYFDALYFAYSQTFGANMRLYMNGNWVFFVNPAAFGWHISNYGCCAFSYQAGAGFGYKF